MVGTSLWAGYWVLTHWALFMNLTFILRNIRRAISIKNKLSEGWILL